MVAALRVCCTRVGELVFEYGSIVRDLTEEVTPLFWRLVLDFEILVCAAVVLGIKVVVRVVVGLVEVVCVVGVGGAPVVGLVVVGVYINVAVRFITMEFLMVVVGVTSSTTALFEAPTPSSKPAVEIDS